MKKEYLPTPAEAAAIGIISKEKTNWENGLVQVTRDVQFNMRDRINQSRKNYLGVYESPLDPNGNEKKWLHLTFNLTEIFVRNSDIDTKDINIRAKKPESYGIAAITRFVLRHFLELINFGELVNDFIRRYFIDGTAINKSLPGIDGSILRSYNVDRLNFFIDPAANSIQAAEAVIERHVMDIDDFKRMPWENLNYVIGEPGADTYSDLSRASKGTVPQVVVYERWGKLPLFCLTGKEEDRNDWVSTVAIVSGIDSGQTIVHRLIANPLSKKKGDNPKPYEEAWFIRVPGRWDGMGVPEALYDIQEQLNEIGNIRLNNARILQNGLFKARIGSGITPQMLSRLSDGGVIPVKNMGDLEQLSMPDIKASSYQMEDRLYNWAQRITGGFQFPGAGEPLPSSTPATNALLQQQNARTTFDTAQENLGLALVRIVKNHWLPIIFEKMKAAEVLRITGDPDEIEELDEQYVTRLANKEIINFITVNAAVPRQTMVELFKEQLYERLKKYGQDRFIAYKKEMFDFDYDVEVYVTNEIFDKVTIINQLQQLLVNLSQVPGLNVDITAVAKEILDIMGIGGRRFFNKRSEALSRPVPPASRRKPQELPPERTSQMIAAGPAAVYAANQAER